jgi:hypothetical protein
MRATGNRTTLIAALIAGALGGALSARILPAAIANAAAPKTLMNVTARNFEVMDANGNERAKLGVSSQGLAQLGMYDEQGVERTAIAVTRQGTALFAMMGEDGKPLLTANVPMHGGAAAFKLLNSNSSTAAELMMNKDGRALMLADNQGHPRVRLDFSTAQKGGVASITLYGKDGKVVQKLP